MKNFVGLAALAVSATLLAGCASAPNLEKEKLAAYTEVAQASAAGDQFLQFGPAAEGEGFKQYQASVGALNSLIANSDTLSDQVFIEESQTLLANKNAALSTYGADISTFYRADIQDRIDRHTGSDESKAALNDCLTLADNIVETLASSTDTLADVHELSSCSLMATSRDSISPSQITDEKGDRF